MQDTLKLRIKVLVVVFLSIVLTVSGSSVALSVRDSNYYPSNYKLNGFSLGKVPKSQTIDFLNEEYSKKELILDLPDKQIKLGLAESGITLSFTDIMDQLDKESSLLHNVISRGKSHLVRLVFKWDEKQLSEAVEKLARDNTKPAINAQINIVDNKIEYSPHQIGYSINPKELLTNIKKHLYAGDLGPIEVKPDQIIPVVELSMVQDYKEIIAISAQKHKNLNDMDELIISTLNHTIILPGENIDLINLWSKNNVNINQSTMISVLDHLLSDISAQLQLNYKHLQVVNNNSNKPIYLNLYQEDDLLWLTIIGKQTDGQKSISISSEIKEIMPEVTQKTDYNLKPGEQKVLEGKSTLITSLYRVVEVGGEEVEKVLLDEKVSPGYNTLVYTSAGTVNK